MRFRFTHLLFAAGLLHVGIAHAAEPRIVPLAVGNVYTFPSKEYGPRQLKVLKINNANGSTTVDVQDLTYNMKFALPGQAFVNRPSIPATPKPTPTKRVTWSSLETSAPKENPAQPKLDDDLPWPGDIFVLRPEGQPPRQVEVVRNEAGVTQVRDRKTDELFPMPTSTLVDMIRMCKNPGLELKPTPAIEPPRQAILIPPQLKPEPKAETVAAKLDDNQPWPGDIFVLRSQGESSRQVEVVRIEARGMTQVRDRKTDELFTIPTSTLVEMIRICQNPETPELKPVLPKLNPEPQVAAKIVAPTLRLELPKELPVVTDTPLSMPTDKGVSRLNTGTAIATPTPIPLLKPRPKPIPISNPTSEHAVPRMANGMPSPDAIAALMQDEPTKPMAQPIVPKIKLPSKRLETVRQPEIVTAPATPTVVQPASLRSPVAELLPARIPPQQLGIRPMSRAGITQMRQEIGPQLYDMVHALRPSLRQRAVSVVANGRYNWRPEVQQLIAKVAIEDPAPEVRAHCIATLSKLGYHDRDYLTHLAAWAESDLTNDVQQAAHSAYSKLMPQ